MTDKPKDPKPPIGDPPTKKTVQTEEGKTPAAGRDDAARDQPEKPSGDEETMPVEEGFSIVP
jgi:hypothetical protein